MMGVDLHEFGVGVSDVVEILGVAAGQAGVDFLLDLDPGVKVLDDVGVLKMDEEF